MQLQQVLIAESRDLYEASNEYFWNCICLLFFCGLSCEVTWSVSRAWSITFQHAPGCMNQEFVYRSVYL